MGVESLCPKSCPGLGPPLSEAVDLAPVLQYFLGPRNCKHHWVAQHPTASWPQDQVPRTVFPLEEGPGGLKRKGWDEGTRAPTAQAWLRSRYPISRLSFYT